MVKIVIDTSIFIDHIRRGKSLEKLVDIVSRGGKQMLVPVIVVGELLAGKSMKTRADQKQLLNMFRGAMIVDINSEVACEYGKVRRSGQAFGNDAWIAACCLVHKARLATLNKKHFIDVKGLKLYNLDK